MCAVAEAVGLDVVIRAYEGKAPSLRDTGQLALAEILSAEADAAWQPHLELLIGQHGEAIDTAFFGAAEIIATEIERMATDFQAQYRRADRKRQALATQHQPPGPPGHGHRGHAAESSRPRTTPGVHPICAPRGIT